MVSKRRIFETMNSSKLVVWFLLLAVAAAIGGGGYVLYSTGTETPPPGILPSFTGERLIPHPDGLATVISIAHHQPLEPALVIQMDNPQRGDRADLRDYLPNAALQQGWYIHNAELNGFEIVIPTSDLQKLNKMTHKPEKWLLKHYDLDAEAKPPDNLDLINVDIRIKSDVFGRTDYLVGYKAAAFFIWIIVGVVAIGGGMLLHPFPDSLYIRKQ